MKIQTCLLPVIFWLSISHAEVREIPADSLINWLTTSSTIDYLIDVREPTELDSIIATTNCRPYNLPWSSEILKDQMGAFSKNSTIVIYCRSGARSLAAANYLSDNGFSYVYSLDDGFSNWRGPKMEGSKVKPLSALPEYSMAKAATFRISHSDAVDQHQQLRERNGWLLLDEQVATTHFLTIYNLSGTRVVAKRNPFISSTAIQVPAELTNQKYVARITGSRTNCTAVIFPTSQQ